MDERTQPPKYLTATQVCARYGDCDRVTLWRWVNAPRTGFPAPALRINGRPLWSESDLNRYDDIARKHAARRFGEIAQ